MLIFFSYYLLSDWINNRGFSVTNLLISEENDSEINFKEISYENNPYLNKITTLVNNPSPIIFFVGNSYNK